MNTKMKAVIVTRPGGPDVLTWTDVDMPRIARPTDVLVRVVAAGVNPADCQNRAFGPPGFVQETGAAPFSILGIDGSGVVEAVGSEVKHLQPGDEVWYVDGGYADRHGSHAQFKVVDGAYLSMKPKSLDFDRAAALPVVALTAWEAVVERANVKPGDIVLVHGGAGGLGHFSIQLARHRGARVATTVSSAVKGDLARQLGAEHVINYREDDVRKSLSAWAGQDGADVVLDFVGRQVFADSINLVAPYGTLVNTVVAPWPQGDNMAAEYKNLSIKFVNIGLPQITANHALRLRQVRMLDEISRLVDAGELGVHLDRVLPLKRIAEAHRALEAGEILGRIVVRP